MYDLLLQLTLVASWISLGTVASSRTEDIDIYTYEDYYDYYNYDYYGQFSNPEEKKSNDTESERILGGHPAAKDQFPFVIGIWRKRGLRPHCGGSLVSSKWILTAAHCVYGSRAHRLKVVLGDLDVRHTETGELTRAVCRIVNHPYYGQSGLENDIALIEMCDPIIYSPSIQPIALGSPKVKLLSGDKVTVAGWGTQLEGGRTSKILRYTSVNTIDALTCRRPYPWISDGQLCAGLLVQGGKDACQGDSGGPLFWKDPDSQESIQVGIVSNGHGCGRPNYPGVYTKVSHYFAWILETMASKDMT